MKGNINMTIPESELGAVSVIAPTAQAMNGTKNPFITLQSLESLCQGDETLTDCLKDMVTYSLRYTCTVCRFEEIVSRGQKSNEDGTRAEIEQVRSTTHDATISAINIFSRALASAGKDNSWIAKVANSGRAGYGKFAILIAFEVVLGKEV